MTIPRTWRGRPPGISIHLGPELGGKPKVPAWLPQPRRVARVRIGSSLCPRLLPNPDRLRHAMRSAQRMRARLELETPPVGDRDLDRLRALLERLSESWPGTDVVVNDWGALRLLQREHPNLQPVVGRVLHRQMRDPRIPAVDPQRMQGIPPGWGRGSATSPSWVRLVRRAGVRRAEVDWPLHGLDLPAWRELDLELTLHLPLVLVASGRSCVLRDPRGARDRADGGERCDLSCAHTAIHLEAPWEAGPEAHGRPEMIRLGNAELVRLPVPVLEQALAWIDGGGAAPDRIAVFPEGP